MRTVDNESERARERGERGEGERGTRGSCESDKMTKVDSRSVERESYHSSCTLLSSPSTAICPFGLLPWML